jgi:hypothetical protein
MKIAEAADRVSHHPSIIVNDTHSFDTLGVLRAPGRNTHSRRNNPHGTGLVALHLPQHERASKRGLADVIPDP